MLLKRPDVVFQCIGTLGHDVTAKHLSIVAPIYINNSFKKVAKSRPVKQI